MEQQAVRMPELAQPDQDMPMPDAGAAVAADAAADAHKALPNGDAHVLNALVDASSAPPGDDILDDLAMHVGAEAKDEVMAANVSLAEVSEVKVRCSGLTPASANG